MKCKRCKIINCKKSEVASTRGIVWKCPNCNDIYIENDTSGKDTTSP